jgi:membrane protein
MSLPITRRTLNGAQRILSAALNDRLLQVASSLAFTTILAIVPLLAVTLSLLTAFPLFANFETSLEDFLKQQLMPKEFSETVMSYLQDFAQKASSLSAIGGGFLLVTSILIIMSIDEALNDIWHIKQQRPIGQRLLTYWAVLTLGPVIFGASLWASSFMIQSALEITTVHRFMPWQMVSNWLPFVITTVGCTLLFVAVPNCRVKLSEALIGALVSGLLFELIKWGLGIYFATIPTYTVIYGAFSVLPAFLLWVYLSWLALLSGAVVAANLPSRVIENRQPVHLHHDNPVATTYNSEQTSSVDSPIESALGGSSHAQSQ